MDKDWKEVDFEGKFKFSVPVSVSAAEEQGIDSSIGLWKGKGIMVRVDYGLYSDPLTSYTDRANYSVRDDEIDGQAARMILFDDIDGRHFVAGHFGELPVGSGSKPRRLTVVVEASQEVGKVIPIKIIESIRFTGGTQCPVRQ